MCSDFSSASLKVKSGGSTVSLKQNSNQWNNLITFLAPKNNLLFTLLIIYVFSFISLQYWKKLHLPVLFIKLMVQFHSDTSHIH